MGVRVSSNTPQVANGTGTTAPPNRPAPELTSAPLSRTPAPTDAAHRPSPSASLDGFAGDPNFMTSLARGLLVVQAFTQQHPVMTISQVSVRTGLSRAAVRRCLYTLSKLGFAGTDDGSRYALRPRMLSLSHTFTSSNTLSSAAQPVLERMSAGTQESFSVATLDGDDIVYIARSSANRVMAVDLHIGSRLPAYCTSMGRILLAFLPPEQTEQYLARAVLTPHTTRTVTSAERLRLILKTVRRNGYALCDQEFEVGLRSLAVPVFTTSGRVVATLNLSGSAPRLSVLEMQTRFLPLLRNAASELSVFLR